MLLLAATAAQGAHRQQMLLHVDFLQTLLHRHVAGTVHLAGLVA
jgi:hypothetical protein